MYANVLAALWSKNINKPNIYQMMRRYTNCGAVLSRSVVSSSGGESLPPAVTALLRNGLSHNSFFPLALLQ